MDYLKTVVPSQLFAERGSNLVVINPGSANIRIGLAQQESPFNIPHCIARYTSQRFKLNVQDQLLNSQATTEQRVEWEKAHDVAASLLKIPFSDDEVARNALPGKKGRADGDNSDWARSDPPFAWTDVHATDVHISASSEKLVDEDLIDESQEKTQGANAKELNSFDVQFRLSICGDEALRISPGEPYTLRRPIRRGHLNISQHYTVQQVLGDLHAIWDWILSEKLHIFHSERKAYSAVLVLSESFENREIKELLSIVLRDLNFSSAVVHQEGLTAVFGNGLSTACVVNLGAQVTSIICVEDGVALVNSEKILLFGGEDVSRCLLWTQKHHQTWPNIQTDILARPVDLLMLNKLKEAYCEIKDGKLDVSAVIHSYEDGMPVECHHTSLVSLNVPPMGLFYPTLLISDIYPSPPRSWFHDYEDVLEDAGQMDYPRRPDMADGLLPGIHVGLPVSETYPVFYSKPKKEEKVGLAEAIASSILSTGRLELQRKLFGSIQLIGGVALTNGLVPTIEERVLLAIPSDESMHIVEVLQSRTNPLYASWKGGASIYDLEAASLKKIKNKKKNAKSKFQSCVSRVFRFLHKRHKVEGLRVQLDSSIGVRFKLSTSHIKEGKPYVSREGRVQFWRVQLDQDEILSLHKFCFYIMYEST